jgi:alkanesulfonate monooxygenase SsuD/methylene tetrahydromethanopterin reductase-like flavin-dependent oxidoreductase (luciferase family)
MTRATAEVADGLLVMPFGSKKYLHEKTMPAVREGLAAAGRDADDLAVVPEIIVSVGEDHAFAQHAGPHHPGVPVRRLLRGPHLDHLGAHRRTAQDLTSAAPQ